MNTLNQLETIVLTGSRPGRSPLLLGTGLQGKAMLPLLGQPMLCYVLKALAQSHYKTKVTLCGTASAVRELADEKSLSWLPGAEQAVDTMLQALNALPGEGYVLFATGDHPLLTAEMVDYFVTDALSRNLAFAVGAVRKRVIRRTYPQARRTYFAIRGEAYSGANLFLVDRRRFSPNPGFMTAIDRNRKSPWRHAFLFEPFTALKLGLRRLSLAQINQLASKKLGCEAGLVDLPFAEACMDVDKPDDLRLAEQILRARHQDQCFVDESQDWRNAYA